MTQAMDDLMLPPLPTPLHRFAIEVNALGGRMDYTAKDMREYARKAVDDFIARSGQYLTNDSSREAAIRAAVEAEREACATLCDGEYYRHIGPEYGEVRYGIAACAAAIRARR